MLPLTLSLSQRQLRFITLLGTGVLVGTSLIVIIPEGIDTMYSVGKMGHAHTASVQTKPDSSPSHPQGIGHPNGFPGIERSEPAGRGFPRRARANSASATVIEVRTSPPRRRSSADDKSAQKEKNKEESHDAHDPHDPHAQPQKGGDDDSTEGHKEGHTRVHAPEGHEEALPHDDADEERDPHAYIGVSLVLGFILM